MFLALAALDRRRGRIERAKAVHRTVLASADLPSEQRVAALVGLGRDLLAEGNERAAIGALVRAVSLAPRSVATLETLARALERAGAWERAAAAWERLEKQVEGRRAQDARAGRGHAVAGQAVEALEDGEDRKARKLAERAVDSAPDSGHCWTVRARVESALGDPTEALESWQRAWELSPVGARVIVPEAWSWASENRRQEDVMERMLSSLRMAREPQLVVALAEKVSRQHSEQAASALERVAERSPWRSWPWFDSGSPEVSASSPAKRPCVRPRAPACSAASAGPRSIGSGSAAATVAPGTRPPRLASSPDARRVLTVRP